MQWPDIPPFEPCIDTLNFCLKRLIYITNFVLVHLKQILSILPNTRQLDLFVSFFNFNKTKPILLTSFIQKLIQNYCKLFKEYQYNDMYVRWSLKKTHMLHDVQITFCWKVSIVEERFDFDVLYCGITHSLKQIVNKCR